MRVRFDRLRGVCISLALAIAPASAGVPGDRVDDYSHAITLHVSGKEAVVQLALPRSVYLNARSPDLSDLRVFDAGGHPISFALVEQARQERENRSSAPVSIFPVYGPAGSTDMSNALEIRTGNKGAVISVTSPATRSQGDVLVSLVLDMGEALRASAPVAGFALTLPPELSRYNAQVAVDTSDDLQEWEELGVASLSWLVNNQGASVTRNRIAFEPRTFRFARLRWIEGNPIEFTAVSAELVARRRTHERWDSVVLQPTLAASGGDLLYATPVALPVQSLGLDLRGHNVVMPILAGQYRKVRDGRAGNKVAVQLQPVLNATFFRLTQNGRQRASGDISVPLTHASQWVVRPQANIPEKPGLRLRWRPASIVFVTSGRLPYTLAFGRDDVKSGQVPISQVAPGFSVSELAMLEQAVPGEPVQRTNVQGPRAAEEAADASRTRVISLWALLLAGVAVLGMMVWRLVRQMKHGPGNQPTV